MIWLRWITRGIGLACLLAGAGCQQRQCNPPSAVSYSCQPLPVGSAGCKGGPAFGSPTGARDPDKVFPVGCAVQLPFCLFDDPTAFQTCRCLAPSPPVPRDAGADGGADAGVDGGADAGAGTDAGAPAPAWVCAV